MKSFVKRYWLYIALTIILVWFLRKSIFTTVENYQLAKSGCVTKARITSREWESSSYRNSDGFYYIFSINGGNYEGHTFDKDVTIGDSIKIVFLPHNPSINRPFDFIQRNYNTKIKDK